MGLVTFFITCSFWAQLLRDSDLGLGPEKAGACSGRKAFFHPNAAGHILIDSFPFSPVITLSAPHSGRQSLMFCMKVFPISFILSG